MRLWRLLFIWGLISLAVIFWTRGRSEWRRVQISMAWMILGLLPYSFLTYLNFVPSRRTYLASVGLALLVGTAAWGLQESRKYAVLAVLCGLALAHNLEILWVKKMAQYRERAEPSEILKSATVPAVGPVYVECVPLPQVAAQAVLQSVGKQAVFQHPGEESGPHCFAIQYRDSSGKWIEVKRLLGTAKHGAFY